MTTTKKGGANSKIAKGKKLVVKKARLPKSFNSKSPIRISLCMDDFIKGLRVDLIVDKKGEDHFSFVALALDNEPIAFFDLELEQSIDPADGGLDVFGEIIGQGSRE